MSTEIIDTETESNTKKNEEKNSGQKKEERKFFFALKAATTKKRWMKFIIFKLNFVLVLKMKREMKKKKIISVVMIASGIENEKKFQTKRYNNKRVSNQVYAHIHKHTHTHK